MTDVPDILVKMRESLPNEFVLDVARLAESYRGARDLLQLWLDASDADRTEIECALAELVNDTSSPPVDRRLGNASAEAVERAAYKQHLAELVRQAGGPSVVARRAGMHQPTLSRLLNGMSLPRAATVDRLARGLRTSPACVAPNTWRGERRPGFSPAAANGADTYVMGCRGAYVPCEFTA